MIAGRLLRLLLITALLPCVLTTCVYADTSLPDTGTAYAEGFASALIESHLHWLDDTYRLTDKGGTLYVSLPSSWKGDASTVERLLADVPGVHSVSVTAAPAALPSNTAATTANWPILAGTPFPRGRLFAPLIADPKQPSFFASYRLYHMPWGNYHVGAVGYGGTLGLYRWHQRLWGGQVQLDFSAGAFSQFDLDVPAPELINTDYTVGLPLTWRRGSDSARLNLYHQSSHLGPLYFSQFHPQNYALSFEAVTFLWSHRWAHWRWYGGGGYLFGTTPATLKRPELHSGIEYHGGKLLWGCLRLIGGLDIKSWAETGWTPALSLKFGVRYSGPDPAERQLSLLLEAYNGYSPNGQFYKFKTNYLGVGAYLGF